MSTVYNKKYFTDLLEKLVLPLKEHYPEECANLYLGHTGAAFEDRTIPMEGFSRVLWGLVPLWVGGEISKIFGNIRQRFKCRNKPKLKRILGRI